MVYDKAKNRRVTADMTTQMYIDFEEARAVDNDRSISQALRDAIKLYIQKNKKLQSK